MKIKVSIVVPVYKTEKFIHRCIDALICQTLTDIEIILVDDGSPDNCGKICEDYAKQDKRIKVIHKKNGGLSSARNTGIREASGEYIGFVDSDDYVEQTFCECMYKTAKKFNIDIVNCDYYWESETSEARSSSLKKDKVIYNEEILEYLKKAHATTIIWFVWRNIYRRSFLIKNNIFFAEEVRFGEDSIFNLYAFYYAKSLYSVDKCLYHYISNPNGLIQTKYKENLLEKFYIQYKVKELFYKIPYLADIEYRQDFCRNNIEHSLILLLTNTYNIAHKDYLQQLKQIRESEFIQQSFKNYKPSGNLSKNMQMVICLFEHKLYFLINLLFRLKKMTSM
ncbi:MAG: glycosyltransferase [Veillonellales bacterium]